MSRHGSLDSTIRLVEECRRILKDADSIIADLRGVAIDVRYGGRWNGAFENVAEALDRCVRGECGVCSYRGDPQGCRMRLKRDAAACIRQMAVLLNGGKKNEPGGQGSPSGGDAGTAEGDRAGSDDGQDPENCIGIHGKV